MVSNMDALVSSRTRPAARLFRLLDFFFLPCTPLAASCRLLSHGKLLEQKLLQHASCTLHELAGEAQAWDPCPPSL